LGKASSSRGNDFEDEVNDIETRLFRNAEARRGTASSGLDECDKSGMNGLYASGCSRRAEASDGESATCQYLAGGVSMQAGNMYTIDQICCQNQDVLYDICPFGSLLQDAGAILPSNE